MSWDKRFIDLFERDPKISGEYFFQKSSSTTLGVCFAISRKKILDKAQVAADFGRRGFVLHHCNERRLVFLGEFCLRRVMDTTCISVYVPALYKIVGWTAKKPIDVLLAILRPLRKHNRAYCTIPSPMFRSEADMIVYIYIYIYINTYI